ncbi:hypothetical protein JCM10296v2_006124 [Rhodotorula toruloides]
MSATAAPAQNASQDQPRLSDAPRGEGTLREEDLLLLAGTGPAADRTQTPYRRQLPTELVRLILDHYLFQNRHEARKAVLLASVARVCHAWAEIVRSYLWATVGIPEDLQKREKLVNILNASPGVCAAVRTLSIPVSDGYQSSAAETSLIRFVRACTGVRELDLMDDCGGQRLAAALASPGLTSLQTFSVRLNHGWGVYTDSVAVVHAIAGLAGSEHLENFSVKGSVRERHRSKSVRNGLTAFDVPDGRLGIREFYFSLRGETHGKVLPALTRAIFGMLDPSTLRHLRIYDNKSQDAYFAFLPTFTQLRSLDIVSDKLFYLETIHTRLMTVFPALQHLAHFSLTRTNRGGSRNDAHTYPTASVPLFSFLDVLPPSLLDCRIEDLKFATEKSFPRLPSSLRSTENAMSVQIWIDSGLSVKGTQTTLCRLDKWYIL